MSDFHDALRRQDASRAADDRRTALDNAAATQREAAAAKKVNQAWADLARHLTEQGARTFQYRHYVVNWKSKLASHHLPPSPAGFVVRAQGDGHYGERQPRLPQKAWRNLTSLELLTPDGRLWNHNLEQGNPALPPKQGFVDTTTPEAVLSRDGIRIDAAGSLLRFDRDGSQPYFDWLARLAQQMRSPTHCAWLWT